MRRWSSRPATSTSCASSRETCPGSSWSRCPSEVELPPEDGETFAGERAGQGARGAPGDRPAGDRRRLRDRGARARRRARACAPPASPARSATDEENLAQAPRRARRRGATARSPTSARSRYVGERRRGDCSRDAARATLAREPRGDRRLRLRPGLRPGRHRPGDERTMAELRPTRSTRSATAGRAARAMRARGRPSRAATDDRDRSEPGSPSRRAAGGLDRLELDPDRAQAGRRGDHRLDRDPDRGAPLLDRPDRLGDRLRLGPPRRRAGRRASIPTATRRRRTSRPRSRGC